MAETNGTLHAIVVSVRSRPMRELNHDDASNNTVRLWSARRLLPVAFFLLLAWHLARAVSSPSPLYGGDEYAYLISGVFLDHLSNVTAADPSLQRINNPLFLKLVYLASHLTTRPAAIIKLLNVASYALTILLLTVALARTTNHARGVAFAAVAFVLPSSTYAVSMMPDPMFYAVAMLALTAPVLMPSSLRWLTNFLPGAMTAVALLIKPHGLALLAALPLALAYLASSSCDRERRWRESARAVLTFSVGVYVVLIAAAPFLVGRLVITPTYFLGDMYSHIAVGMTGAIATRLYESGRLLIGSILLILLYVGPFIFMVGASLLTSAKDPPSSLNRKFRYLTLAILLVSAATLGMVAMFTASQALEFEKNRLHGRYYAHIYLLIVWAALMIPNWARVLDSGPRLRLFKHSISTQQVLALSWATMIVVVPIALSAYNIYPWDNPEAMPFYRVKQSTWKWTGGLHGLEWIALAALFAAAIVIGFGPASVVMRSALAAVLAVFVAATLQTRLWQVEHLANVEHLSTTGRFIRTWLEKVPDREIAIVGQDRYGRMAYLLFGMSCACKVVVLSDGQKTVYTKALEGISHVINFGRVETTVAADTLLVTNEVTVLRLRN